MMTRNQSPKSKTGGHISPVGKKELGLRPGASEAEASSSQMQGCEQPHTSQMASMNTGYLKATIREDRAWRERTFRGNSASKSSASACSVDGSSVGLTDEVSKQTVSSSQDVHSDQPEITLGLTVLTGKRRNQEE